MARSRRNRSRTGVGAASAAFETRAAERRPYGDRNGYARRARVGDVVNLNRFRKRKREAQERARADENAVRHGQTAADEDHVDRERERRDAMLDGARRDTPAAAPPTDDDDDDSDAG